jgi:hypothetical protein
MNTIYRLLMVVSLVGACSSIAFTAFAQQGPTARPAPIPSVAYVSAPNPFIVNAAALAPDTHTLGNDPFGDALNIPTLPGGAQIAGVIIKNGVPTLLVDKGDGTALDMHVGDIIDGHRRIKEITADAIRLDDGTVMPVIPPQLPGSANSLDNDGHNSYLVPAITPGNTQALPPTLVPTGTTIQTEPQTQAAPQSTPNGYNTSASTPAPRPYGTP